MRRWATSVVFVLVLCGTVALVVGRLIDVSLAAADQVAGVAGFALTCVLAWEARRRSRMSGGNLERSTLGVGTMRLEAPSIALPRRMLSPPVASPDGARLHIGDPGLAVAQLGVHRAIELPVDDRGGLDVDLPIWIDRDVRPKLRSWLETARTEGGFVVVVGDSAVGKSRLLYEAALEALPGWPVIVIRRGDRVAVDTLPSRVEGGFVLWVDELYRLLPGPGLPRGATPLMPSAIDTLLNARQPVVILGSMWPAQLASCLAVSSEDHGITRPEHGTSMAVLNRAQRLVLEGFNENERQRAQTRAADDPRLARALADPHFGLTQVLAGAGPLIERYEAGSDGQKAILRAAVDAERLGVRPPLPREFLVAARRGYLAGIEEDDNSVGTLLEELTRHGGPYDRATAPLIEIPDADHRQVVGYQVADYLLQHVSRRRRSDPIPDSTWIAAIAHTTRTAHLHALGRQAERRGRQPMAELAYRRAMGIGDKLAAKKLVELFSARADTDALRELALDGVALASKELVPVLVARGDIDSLRELAATGDRYASEALAATLSAEAPGTDATVDDRDTAPSDDRAADDRSLEPEDDEVADDLDEDFEDEDEDEADEGDKQALLDHMLSLQRRNALPITGRRPHVEGRRSYRDGWVERDPASRDQRDDLDPDELRTRADAGDAFAARQLADLLAKMGDEDQLRDRSDAGDTQATDRLADLLADRADRIGLRMLATAGSARAAAHLASALAQAGDLEGLRERADLGDTLAATKLLDALVARHDLAALHREVDAGTPGAAERITDLQRDPP